MTTFIADYIFGTRRRPSRPGPSLAQRLLAGLGATGAQPRDAGPDALPPRTAPSGSETSAARDPAGQPPQTAARR